MQLAGFFAQVDINNLPYTVSEWRVDVEAPALETTNSEAVNGAGAPDTMGFKTSVSGVSVAKIMLKTATFDDTDDIFAAPLALREAMVVSVRIFHDTRLGTAHVFPRVRITKLTVEGQSSGLQPITLEGETDGGFTLRNQAAGPRTLTTG